MEKLNELVELAEEVFDLGVSMDRVEPETILAIAKAFRALEHRAEAAEAHLAELAKQKPAAQFYKSDHGNVFNTLDGWNPVEGVNELFTRPAPAINLAELVPDEKPDWGDEDCQDIDYMEPSEVYRMGKDDGWNACRAAILRNIEVAK